MRVAIDVTAMPRQKVGAGYYMQNLVQGLAEIESTNNYLIFTPKENRTNFAVTRPNFIFEQLPSDARLTRLLWEQWVLPLRLKQRGADILHSTHYTTPITGAIRRIVTFHDMTFLMYPEMHTAGKRFFFTWMIRFAARRADAIVADSNSTRHDVLRLLKIDPEKVFAVPLGVSSRFCPNQDAAETEAVCRRYGLPQPFILHVGELQPRKNMPRLVQAFKQIKLRGLPHRLVFVGRKGWMYGELFKTLQELDIADQVIFPGYVPESDLPFLYNAADLSVYPSLYEGFGLPVLEALACGTPVVTSNVSSMPEIIGDAGILVNPRQVEAIAEAMYRVLTDRALHDDLSRRGIERARLFPWERTARETLAVYERVVKF
jgi:glycosyltransferase involved in cell wall biosynthesis